MLFKSRNMTLVYGGDLRQGWATAPYVEDRSDLSDVSHQSRFVQGSVQLRSVLGP